MVRQNRLHIFDSPLGTVVVVAAGFNLASLLHVLYVGQVHPVRYELVWPGAPGSLPVLGVGSLAVAGAILIGLWVWAAARLGRGGRRLDGSLLWHLGRAWVPASVAAAWAVRWVADPRLGLLVVLGCIVLVAWGAARFAREVVDLTPAQSGPGRPTAPTAEGLPCWWREGGFWAVVIVSLGLTVFHTYVQIKLHRGLQYGSPDIGYYAEMLLNVLRGRGLFCEAFGHHFFGEHFSPGLYLLVPLYACYPHIETLMVLGAGLVLSGSWAVYALTRAHRGSAGLAMGLAAAYLLYPSIGRILYGASYGFHEILAVIPLMLWSFYHYARKQRLRMLLLMVLAVSFKENVAIVYGVFGVYVFVRNRRHWWGLVLCGVCILHFAIVLMWIVPAFNAGGAYSKFYLYDNLGGSPTGLLTALVTQPSLFIERFLCWRTFCFALALALPLGMVVFRRPVVLVALPTFGFICLMNTPDFASIRFWHQASLLPVLWLAAVQAVTDERVGRAGQASRAMGIMCCCALTHYALGFSPLSRVWREVPLDVQSQTTVVDRLHEMIPRTDTVQATARLAAHFVEQARVYPLHDQPPVAPDWIVLDSLESFTDPENRGKAEESARRAYESGQYELALQAHSILVFRKAR